MGEHDADEERRRPDPEDGADIERVSAYLDGEASPEEVARIEADPVLRRRAAELAAASELIAAPFEPLDDGAWDAIVAGAAARVASAAPAPVTDPAASASAPVTELAPPPAPVADLAAHRRARSRLAAVVGVAAACLLLVALGVTAVRRTGGSDRPPELAGPPPSSAAAPTTSEVGSQGGLGVTEGSGTTSPAQAADEFRSVYVAEDLGSFLDEAALTAAVAQAMGQRTATGTSVVAGGDPALAAIARCTAAVRRDDRRLGRIRFATNATYQDKPVYVLVFQDFGIAQGQEPRRVVVVGRDSCDVALSAPL